MTAGLYNSQTLAREETTERDLVSSAQFSWVAFGGWLDSLVVISASIDKVSNNKGIFLDDDHFRLGIFRMNSKL